MVLKGILIDRYCWEKVRTMWTEGLFCFMYELHNCNVRNGCFPSAVIPSACFFLYLKNKVWGALCIFQLLLTLAPSSRRDPGYPSNTKILLVGESFSFLFYIEKWHAKFYACRMFHVVSANHCSRKTAASWSAQGERCGTEEKWWLLKAGQLFVLLQESRTGGRKLYADGRATFSCKQGAQGHFATSEMLDMLQSFQCL